MANVVNMRVNAQMLQVNEKKRRAIGCINVQKEEVADCSVMINNVFVHHIHHTIEDNTQADFLNTTNKQTNIILAISFYFFI